MDSFIKWNLYSMKREITIGGCDRSHQVRASYSFMNKKLKLGLVDS